ncbi:glycosyl hydrolase 108 family protein [Parvicella tangerina]|uniref:TtsA-like Glycoside hydrolase family 108 domain-containing protein n=1 Tax=Parvicella tangerina TaxID=2829795 RepID=A0A916NH69_9FLAO|nr:glycosyl hydrolase 108 family protein [Parvicella tangerina]CAG5082260.1 hypothetical protein CRYO30217_01857 [Parvicella tangerina]
MKRFKQIAKKIGLTGKYTLSLTNERSFTGGQFVGTKWGITAPMLAEYLGRTPKADDMKELTQNEAFNLLYQRLWLGMGLINLDHKDVAALIYLGLTSIGTTAMRLNLERVADKLKHHINHYEVFTPKGIDLLNSLDHVALFKVLRARMKWCYTHIGNKNKRKNFLRLLGEIQLNRKTVRKGERRSPELTIQNRIPVNVLVELNKLKRKTA